MSMAETAKLAVDLSFKSNAGTILGSVNRQLGTVDTSAAKLHKGFTTLGAGIGTAIRNGAVLATGALVALGGLIAESVKEGQEATKVQQIYATAIGNSGKVSAAYVGILDAQQTALMNLAGMDDELIKSEQTRLIQMGLTGDAVAKLTPLILDASKATGKDLLTVTIAAGKAANGQATALSRLGIQVDKTRFKIDPLAETVRVLNERFGGTTQALSGNFDTRLGALRENLANIREDIGIKLLPALTRIVDVVGKSLVPAFGEFVDRILPDISKGIDTFASALEGGGAEKSINGIADALGSMIELLKIAAGPVKTIVSAFLSLPKEVQGILVGGFAINKLSGGMIGQGLGQIAGGLIQRGGSPANPLFVADVTGGIGGKVGGALPAAAGAAAGTGLALTTAIVAPAAVAATALIISDQINQQGSALVTQAAGYALKATDAELANSIKGVNEQLSGMQFNTFDSKNKVIDVLNVLIAEQNRRTAGPAAIPGLSPQHGGGAASPEFSLSKFLNEGAQGVFLRGVKAGNPHAARDVAGTMAKNQRIAAELTAIGPGAAGVYARAVHAGFDPSMATVAATLARGNARTTAAAAKADAAARKTAAAVSKTAAAVFAGAEKTGLRLLGVKGAIDATTAAINAKQFTTTIVGSDWYNLPKPTGTYHPPLVQPAVVVHTSSPVSARDVTVKTATRAAYGRDRTIK